MAMIGLEFFRLPAEEKMSLYSDDPAKKMRLSTSFNVQKEKVHNWRDYLRLHCYPLEEYVPGWPSNPPSFREVASTYCKEIRLLGFRLLGLISLSLGLEEGYIERVLGEQEQHMAINYYPPCPEPELTFGLPAHTDPNALTVLLQDQDVPGLQILKDGRIKQWQIQERLAQSRSKFKQGEDVHRLLPLSVQLCGHQPTIEAHFRK
ncbi:uncharacterized protein A4U43_C10F2960 [Asparagus officinalis]|uniref:Fe2OG dioxygenase domain-containing protein n=1 Tax=Asparagus officinalis TaxID=4686 RepID=A0A5P1E3G4_ASPOF|nr:uncharacterized protein A4U43_C10F2960 [Asparagus officinalis]